MNLSGKKLTTAILAGLMGATMFGSSVFADTTLDAVQALAQQNSDKITDLTGRVSKLETASSDATQNTENIAANKTAIAKNADDIATNKDNIAANTTAIAKNAGDIATNKDNIAANKAAIDKNAGNIAANTTAIAANTTAIAANKAAIDKNAGNIAANTTAIAANKTAIDANKTAIDKNAGNIAANTTAIDANKTAIAKNAGDIATVSSTVTALQKDSASVKTAAELINGKTEAIEKVDKYEGRLRTVEIISKNNNDTIGSDTNNTGVHNGTFVKKLSQNTEDPSKSVTIGTNLNLLDAAVAKNSASIGTIKQGKFVNPLSQNTEDPLKSVTIGTNLNTLDDAVVVNKTAIAANKTAIDTNKTAIDANKTAIDTNKTAIDANKTAIDTNKTAIDTNKTAIDANKTAIDANKTAIDANKTAIDTNKTAIAKNAGDIAEVATQAIGTTKDGNYVKSNNSVAQNLNALDDQVGQNSANINQLFSDYSSMKTDINKVGARSAALAGLHPLDFDPANKLNFAVASGSFKGENSVALGAFYRPNENIMFSAASTMGDSDNAYTFGLSFKIGPSSAKTKTTSPDAEELYKVVGELQDQLAAQQKEIEQLKADKAK